jgi:serine/threonine protein kinase
LGEPSFTIEKKINESTTTTVYRAHQIALDREVLLKVLHKHLAQDNDFVERFRREARACAAVHSPNIVQVYDLTEIDGAPAIVMEYVEGRSLKEILDQEGKQSPEFVRRVAAEVLRGLADAHAAGITHRDIKPGNILLSSDGVIKVSDFGLASVPRSPTLTLDGMVLGTPAYMSPEQARGEVVDARSDLFSLGVTLVELLTARRMFEGGTYSDCMKKILSFSVQDIEPLAGELSPDFYQVLRSLLAPRKEDRCAAAKEALRFLQSGVRPVHPATSPMLRWGISVAAILILAAGARYLQTARTTDEKSIPTIRDTMQSSAQKITVVDSAATHRASGLVSQKALSENSRSTVPIAPEHRADSSGGTIDSGSVLIRCKPWATVYLNSVYLGQTPLPRPVSVQAGSATLTLSNPLFAPITRIISIPPHAQVVVDEDFLMYAGYLMVRVIPWAEVYIDDQYRDTTPLGKPLLVSSGSRKVRLHNPSFEDVVLEAHVGKGDTVALSYTLSGKKTP